MFPQVSRDVSDSRRGPVARRRAVPRTLPDRREFRTPYSPEPPKYAVQGTSYRVRAVQSTPSGIPLAAHPPARPPIPLPPSRPTTSLES
ncbi:hypothetical protein Afil01_04870 [Actinorhabdospora filicis]|uniref:Uncharacterized protein n=1 Tax=Actinorhabdospora filicis TaxID=1785913 RepID=A0A9W6W8H5_9ACTN|nr:hypothetical protein Afil01_04870 [Actinorhabdospora filicis]